MIRRIQLQDFMSHTSSSFELAPCLTVLTGPNNCGKSAVVEALQCVCGNSRGDYMRRHGARQASVLIETDEGHIVEWRRTKASSYFVLDGKEIYRVPEPDDLHKMLRLPRVPAKEGVEEFDVHIGEQKRPIFLLDASGSRAATFFASSSDAQYLVQMQQLQADRTRTAKSASRALTADIEELDREREAFARLPEIGTRLAAVEAEYAQLVDSTAEARRLSIEVDDLQGRARFAADRGRWAGVFEALASPPTLLAAEDLSVEIGSLVATMTTATMLGRVSDALEPLIAPPELSPAEALGGAIVQLRGAVGVRRQSAAESAALAPLVPPAAPHDAAGLAYALAARQSAADAALTARTRANALADLPSPPAFHDLDGPRRSIVALRTAERQYDACAAEGRRLDALATPPEVNDLSTLERVVGLFGALTEAHARADRKAAEAMVDLAHVQLDIIQWAKSHPDCPTCGSPVNPDTILDHLAESMAEPVSEAFTLA